MHKSAMVLVLVLMLVPPVSNAWAQGGSEPAWQFGRVRSVSVSAERLFGLSHASPSTGASVTTISLLGGGGIELGSAPYSVPRIGIDGFLWKGLSLGMGAEFAVIDQNAGSITVLGLNPRVGYAVHVSDGFSLS
jgi:hypothetical protein